MGGGETEGDLFPTAAGVMERERDRSARPAWHGDRMGGSEASDALQCTVLPGDDGAAVGGEA